MSESLSDERVIELFNSTGSISDETMKEITLSEDLPRRLTTFHNLKQLDITVFALRLINDKNNNFEYFAVQQVLCESLVTVESPVVSVLKAYAHMWRESGKDFAANFVLRDYGAYLGNNPEVIFEALTLVIDEQINLSCLLPMTLIKGLAKDFSYSINIIDELCCGSNKEFQAHALNALGSIDWFSNIEFLDQGKRILLSTIGSCEDNSVLFNWIVATGQSLCNGLSSEELVEHLLLFIEKNGALARNAIINVFSRAAGSFPSVLEPVLISAIDNLAQEEGGTIQFLDHGITCLFKENAIVKAITLIEKALCASGAYSFDDFPCSVSEMNKKGITNWLATKWLLSGEQALCKAVKSLLANRETQTSSFVVDKNLVDSDADEDIVYIARKAIGFLLFDYKELIGFLVSLVLYAKNTIVSYEIVSLLLNPILVCYPSTGLDELEKCIKDQDAIDNDAFKWLIEQHQKYCDQIDRCKRIPALGPDEDQRYAFAGMMLEQQRQIHKQAKKESFFLSLFKSNTILYGRGSISYQETMNGEIERNDHVLQGISAQIELPMLLFLNPVGLENMMFFFRLERRRSDEDSTS